MPQTYSAQLGPLFSQFQNFDSGGLWSSWAWKLDPYRVSAPCSDSCDLIVRRSFQSDCERLSPGSQQILREEPSGFFLRQVLRAAGGGTDWCFVRRRNGDVCLSYRVSPNWDEITLLADSTQSAGHLAFEYLGQMMPCVFLNHQVLTFHGVLMEHKGQGIILSAPSGTGKTTHARLWRDHKRAVILNGDRATCGKVDGVWTGFGLPWSGTSGEQINRNVPLTALVILERGVQNEAQRITGLESFGAAWPHIQYPGWDAELTGNALELTNEFLCQIPVLRLRCRPDVDSVEVLNRALEEL